MNVGSNYAGYIGYEIVKCVIAWSCKQCSELTHSIIRGEFFGWLVTLSESGRNLLSKVRHLL